MKGNIFKITAVLLFLVGTFSCSEKSEPDPNVGLKKSFIGKWKLEKVFFASGGDEPATFDYSQNNIIYEFKANNTLIVSGSTDKIDYRGHKIGSHFCEMQVQWLSVCPSGPVVPVDTRLYNCLLIDNLSHFFSPDLVLSENLLELEYLKEEDRYVGLFVYSLVKIK